MGAPLERPFIHLHIPKTAGTSLRASYIEAFGAEHVAFMLPEREFVKTSELPFGTEELDLLRRTAREQHLLPQFSTMVQRMNQNRYYRTFPLGDIETEDVVVATGHIRHGDISSSVAHLAVTTVVREPLERAWSHYVHWKEASGSMWWHDGSMSFSEDVGFETFALDPALQNYQAAYLGKLACHTIGTADNLEAFLEHIGAARTPNIPRLNSGLYPEIPVFDLGFLRAFAEYHSQDYELYESAKQSWY